MGRLGRSAPSSTLGILPRWNLIGAALEIAGSELTNAEAAQVFGRVLGKLVKFQIPPMPMVCLFLGKEFYQIFRWFNQARFNANIPKLRRKYREVPLQALEEWLRGEGWHNAPAGYAHQRARAKGETMAATPIREANFSTIWWDEKTHIIRIDWKETITRWLPRSSNGGSRTSRAVITKQA
jgi:hypothetical protein